MRAWFHGHASAAAALMDKLADAVSVYLIAQAEAGAQALQVFDSWAGCLSLADYRRFAAPWTRRVFENVAAATDVPLIHFSANGGHLLDEIATFPCQVLGLDWRVDAAAAIERCGRDRVYQGNFDPARLLADDESIREGASGVLAAFAGTRGHIFNLGHGVIKTTDPAKVRLLVDEVHRLTRR